MHASPQSLDHTLPMQTTLTTSLHTQSSGERHSPLLRRRVPPAIIVCLGLATLLVLAALFAPWLALFDPATQKLLVRLRPPVPLERSVTRYVFGTDELGRDLLSRCLYGLRVPMGIAAFGMVIVLALGLTVGLVSGLVGGRLDSISMMLVDPN